MPGYKVNPDVVTNFNQLQQARMLKGLKAVFQDDISLISALEQIKESDKNIDEHEKREKSLHSYDEEERQL